MASPGTYLLQGVTATGAGAQFGWANYPMTSFFASVAGTGAVTASINVEVTQDPTIGWVVLSTFTLSGTNLAYNGTNAIPNYPFVRGNVTALTGTGATVNLSVYP